MRDGRVAADRSTGGPEMEGARTWTDDAMSDIHRELDGFVERLEGKYPEELINRALAEHVEEAGK